MKISVESYICQEYLAGVVGKKTFKTIRELAILAAAYALENFPDQWRGIKPRGQRGKEVAALPIHVVIETLGDLARMPLDEAA